MLTIVDLQKELMPYKNTLVINEWLEIVKLIDVVEKEDDFYWVYETCNHKIVYDTCCGGWIPLKGQLNDKNYEKILNEWNNNYKNNF